MATTTTANATSRLLARSAAALLLAVAALSWTGCTARPSADGSGALAVDDELAVERTTSAVAEYLAGGTAVTMGDTVAQVEAKLGPPREVTQRTVVNRHDPSSTDTIYDILYDGLYVQLYHARAIDRYLIIRYVVSSDRYPLAQGLGVGVDRQAVVDVLGQPDSVVGDDYIYVAEDFGEHTVMFRFDAERVREIEWLFFVE